MATMRLNEVDKVEILTVLDNTIDMLLDSTPHVKRLPLPPDALTRESLVAEHGFAALLTVTSGNTSDSLIHDDQAVVLHVKGKGLVILTGCGHAGAVNTIRHAQQLTGIQTVYAVIGGLHLSGALFAPIIPPTIAALKALSPALIVPAHCTGWKATHALAWEPPEAFVPNSVGTRFML